MKTLIKNGLLIDPANQVQAYLNLILEDGKVVAVTEEEPEADRVIDATGKVVAPGFIDIHMHEDPVKDGKIEFCIFDAMLRMGVTTAVGGNCGINVYDPVKYLASLNASKEKAEVRLGNVVYNSIKNVLSSTNQADIISGRDGNLAKTITENIGDAMDSYGIHIYAVETKKLDLPDSNKESVYQRMISERNNIAAQYTADGDYQSSLIKNETDKTVKETIAKADAEAEKIKAEGEAKYMQILSEAYNDESKADFYNYVRSLDALKASLKGDNKTVILNQDSELARILSGN